MIVAVLNSDANRHRMAGARIHDYSHPHWRQDVEILVRGAGSVLAYLTLPKATSAAQVAEMILQSHENELSLLPALPEQWPDGEARSLCARGGFEVGLRWAAGLLEQATIFSKIGNTCRIRSTGALKVVSGNKTVRVMKPENNVYEFKTAPGVSYKLTYIK